MRKRFPVMTKRMTAGFLAVILLFTGLNIPANAGEISGDVSVNETEPIYLDISSTDSFEEPSFDDSDHVYSYHHVGYDPETVPDEDVINYEDIDLPSSYNSTLDEIKANNYPDTRDQNPYGTCWAHAAVATAELSLIKNGYKDPSINYSEFALAYFFYHNVTDPMGGTKGDVTSLVGSDDYLNQGGNNVYTWRTLATWMGVSDEKGPLKYPGYNTKVVAPDDKYAYDDEAILTDVKILYPSSQRDLIKAEIYKNGGVAASIYSSMSYYNSTNNTYYVSSAVQTNHAITIVGWDDNIPASDFTNGYGHTPSGDGGWLIRNSWTTTPAMNYNSYFWISYYDGPLNSELMFSQYFVPADTFDNNYQYDGGIETEAFSFCTKTANIFEVGGAKGSSFESLEAVSFSITKYSDVKYNITVYKGVTDGNPESGEKVASIDGMTDIRGYYTVALPEPVMLERGEKFSVVVKTQDYKYIDIEDVTVSYWIQGKVSSERGQSFYYENNKWEDVVDRYGGFYSGNICIKAFTKDNNVIPEGCYRVLFMGNGSTEGFMPGQDITTGEKKKLTPNKYARKGYSFDGWNTSADGTGKSYEDGTEVEDLAAEGQVIKLYAQWKEIVYNVYFDGNGADSGNVDPMLGLLASAGEITLPSNGFVKKGHIFKGWSDSEGKVYEAGESVDCDVTKEDTNVTFKAVWEKARYTVIFNGNGGTASPYSITVTYGDTLDELPTADRDGYNFWGWYTQKIGGEKVTEDTVVSEDITLYAHWYRGKITVTLDPGEGTCDVSGMTVFGDINYGVREDSEGNPTEADLPEAVPYNAEEGYVFFGWFTDPKSGIRVTKDTIVTNYSDHTLYARYHIERVVEDIVSDVYTEEGNPTEVEEGTRISLSTATNMATIFYTTDPDASLKDFVKYKDAIVLTEGLTTIRAYGVKEGYTDSSVASFTYRVKDESADWGDEEGIEEDARSEGYLTPEEIPTGLWLAGIDSETVYTGKAQTWDFRVYDKKTLLQKGKDYTVTYKNNKNAGTATVLVTGKGNYTGAILRSVKIKGYDIASQPVTVQVSDIKRQNKKNTMFSTVKVTGLDGKVLKKGTDYIVTYRYTEDNYVANGKKTVERKAGNVVNKNDIAQYDIKITVEVTGKGNYSGTVIREYSVLQDPTPITDISKTNVNVGKYVYDGNEVTVEEYVSVKYNGNLMVSGNDYEIAEHPVIKNAGTTKVTLVGINGFTGTKTVKFKVSPRVITSDDVIITPANLETVYSKDGAWLEVTVVSNGVTLTQGKDYTLSYSNNKKVSGANGKKAPTVTIKGMGNYSGTVKKTFYITQRSLEDGEIFAEDVYYSGKANAWKSAVRVIDTEGNALTSKDYDITYDLSGNEPEPGSVVYVTATGKGNYRDQVKTKYNILATVDISMTDVSGLDEEFEYSQKGTTPKPTITYMDRVLKEGTDYSLSYKNNKNIGTATVTIKGKGLFEGSSRDMTFKIGPKDISDLSISAPDVVYSFKVGNYISKPVVKDENGVVLKAGTDYTNVKYYYAEDTTFPDGSVMNQDDEISSREILPAGTIIRVEVTGMGKYKGTLTSQGTSESPYTYRIIKGSLSKAKITVPTQSYTGKTVTPGKESVTVKIGKTVLTSDDYEIVGYSRNILMGKAKITIRGKGYYSGEKTGTFKIAKRSMYYTVVYNGNGAKSGSVKKQTIMSEKSVSVSKFGFKKAYHVSDKENGIWNTRPDGSGKAYSQGDKIINNGQDGETLVLYAQWVEIQTPANIRVSRAKLAKNYFNEQRVSWDPVLGASKYNIYVATSENGKYKNVGSVSGTSFTYKKVSAGKTYYYKVSCVMSDTVSGKKISVTGPTAETAVYLKVAKKPSIKAGLTFSSFDVYMNIQNNGSEKIILEDRGEAKVKVVQTYYYFWGSYQLPPQNYDTTLTYSGNTEDLKIEPWLSNYLVWSSTSGIPTVNGVYRTSVTYTADFTVKCGNMKYKMSINEKGKVTLTPIQYLD